MAASLVVSICCAARRPTSNLRFILKFQRFLHSESLALHPGLMIRHFSTGNVLRHKDSFDEHNSAPLVSETAPLENMKQSSPTEKALDKFAKVVDKVKMAQNKEVDVDGSKQISPQDPNESFASMLRRSKFVSLGEHKGRLVQGEIIEVMEDDLYIDFGGKFHCVCPRPKRNGDRYHRGTKVLLNLQCMEMSSAFLGSDIHVTLLEADAILLGLAATSKNKGQTQRNQTQSQHR
ncbi:28S ribosomal protein s28, mitochondrial [Plakobranchus ocellatus]|uniref:28S ribosomal protein s28, mitochondrial n=1 Tax=Plakobranchus ocellatus TaxID=259542 RepID=A0AAV3YU16_9GAST|nr:28S ribosomal protein s28, mitochondrial [Plakobranchus ocellatus]